MLNSDTVTCTMPKVELSSDFYTESPVLAGGGAPSVSSGPYDRDHADIYVGLVFDGFRHYGNLTAAVPNVTFQFFQPPAIDISSKEVVYHANQHSRINITVTWSFSYR